MHRTHPHKLPGPKHEWRSLIWSRGRWNPHGVIGPPSVGPAQSSTIHGGPFITLGEGSCSASGCLQCYSAEKQSPVGREAGEGGRGPVAGLMAPSSRSASFIPPNQPTRGYDHLPICRLKHLSWSHCQHRRPHPPLSAQGPRVLHVVTGTDVEHPHPSRDHPSTATDVLCVATRVLSNILRGSLVRAT